MTLCGKVLVTERDIGEKDSAELSIKKSQNSCNCKLEPIKVSVK